MLVAAAPIDVVVLHEHGRRQDDVGHQGRFRHELLMDADEQVLAGKALFTSCCSGATETGFVFWTIIAARGGP